MAQKRQHRFGLAAVLLAAVLFAAALAAQGLGSDQGEPASATLPQSNEALLLSGHVEEAIQTGDYRLAIELVERLRELPGGLVAAPAARTHYPVWREASRLLARLPEQGVELYRQLYDAEVTARFQQASADADLGLLRELFRRYRLSSAWTAIGAELSAQLLERGAFGEAIEVLREMGLAEREAGSAADGGAAPEQKALLAAALASAGAIRPAGRLLAELQSDSSLTIQPEWSDRLGQMDHWLRALRTDAFGSGAEQQAGFVPLIETGPVWRRELLSDSSVGLRSARDMVLERLVDEGHDIAQAVAVFRRLPVHQPVLAEQTLVVRLRGTLWAFDARTLALRWNVALGLTDQAAGVVAGSVPEGDSETAVRLSRDAQLLMSDHLRHAVSVALGKVYTLEGSALLDTAHGAFGRHPFPVTRDSARRTELVARELSSGRLVWRTAADPASPLFEVAFQNVPVVVGDTLLAPVRRGDELNLAVLDPADGSLIREVPLVGPPTHFTAAGGRCQIVLDETTLYICTGNGVVAALARDDLSWKWATVYASTLAEHLGQLWWQPAKSAVEPNVEAPTITDELLLVAPVDSDPPSILALDRFSGRQRWRMSRREYPFLIGAVADGFVVAGQFVACLDRDDPSGRPPRWRSVPLQITGRSVIRDERVYVPTDGGVVVLDGRNGKVLADQIDARPPGGLKPTSPRDDLAVSSRALQTGFAPSEGPDQTANLLVSGDALFSVSPDRVVKYADLRRVRARCAALAEDEAAGGDVQLVEAWLDALDGCFGDALARLQARRLDDPRLGAARDRLLTFVFLGLARSTPGGEDRLSWLQRALELADSPQSAARLADTIGRALERSGHWEAALRHYGELLCQPGASRVGDLADADRHAASWLLAAKRIAAISSQVTTGQSEQWLGDLLSDIDQDDHRLISLQRLRLALANQPLRSRLDRLLSLERLPPELKVQYLPIDDAPNQPTWLGRRLQLERWDVHVSLGLLDRARDDRALWQTRFAQSASPAETEVPQSPSADFAQGGPLSSAEERELVDGIELAFQKLEQGSGKPFADHAVRQWKIERAELLLDPRREAVLKQTAENEDRGHILAVNLKDGRIELINAFKHQYPQRRTEDRLTDETSDWGRRLSNDVLTFGEPAGRRFEGRARERNAWPMVTYGHLAAIPVQGGLVCVGLGPERYGGRRQWEYPVPEWGGIPVDFARRSVGGRPGVFFTPRRDRVVLVGWFDGEMWWQRELPGVTIERLFLIEGQGSGFGVQGLEEEGAASNAVSALSGTDWLVIVSDDQRVWVTDATYGRSLRELDRDEIGVATPRRIDVVGDTIVVWGSDSVVGVGGRLLRQVWTRPCAPVGDALVVPQRPWLAYRARGETNWHLLDANSGEQVFVASLGEFGDLTAIAVSSERLLVAGRVGPLDEEGQAPVARVIAIDPANGRRLWNRDFASRVGVNLTQLVGHPNVIPILLTGAAGDDMEDDSPEPGLSPPTIQLVSRRSGDVGETFSIRPDYRPVVEATCDAYLLVTPTSMIVQVGGNLIAYGNSQLRSVP